MATEIKDRTHRLSCSLKSTTREIDGYTNMVRDTLKDLLTKDPGSGRYPWQEFTWELGGLRGTRTDRFATFDAYLHKWSVYRYPQLLDLYKHDAKMVALLKESAEVGHGH